MGGLIFGGVGKDGPYLNDCWMVAVGPDPMMQLAEGEASWGPIHTLDAPAPRFASAGTSLSLLSLSGSRDLYTVFPWLVPIRPYKHSYGFVLRIFSALHSPTPKYSLLGVC